MTFEFKPNFTLTSSITDNLSRIDGVRLRLSELELSVKEWRLLRETTRLNTTHYSTMIEGNRLTPEQVEQVLQQDHEIGGRERDVKEVRGYYAASRKIETWAADQEPVSEQLIQKLPRVFHARSEPALCIMSL